MKTAAASILITLLATRGLAAPSYLGSALEERGLLGGDDEPDEQFTEIEKVEPAIKDATKEQICKISLV
jgi:hypothetical protein